MAQQQPNALANHYGTLGGATNSGLGPGSHQTMHPHYNIPGCEQCRELAHYFELDRNKHSMQNVHVMMPREKQKDTIQHVPSA